MPEALSVELVKKFKPSLSPKEKEQLLILFSDKELIHPGIIKAYHDLLLFNCAYPANQSILDICNVELKRLSAAVKDLSSKKLFSLSGTGIAHTEFLCSFSFSFIQFLLSKYPNHISMEDESDVQTAKTLFKEILPPVEFASVMEGDYSLHKRLNVLLGKSDRSYQLRWICDHFQHLQIAEPLKEHLYDNLKIFAKCKIDEASFSHTFLRMPERPFYYEPMILKQFNPLKEINKKINKPVKLSLQGKSDLINVARSSLALNCRETEPFTYADEQETELFDMGRGLHIVLIGMKKDRRLSLESYVGYMAFKNNVPVSYGGGWMFGHRCKIGVNIYPAFRGGESAWIFTQVLRLYHQYFNARTFVVKPYQFGKDNREAIKSGAFWFYYKLGFRQASQTLRTLAESEWEMIISEKKYRTPESILKKFTERDLYLRISPVKVEAPDADLVSAFITSGIITQFGGDRERSVKAAARKMKHLFGRFSLKDWTVLEKASFSNFSLLTFFLKDCADWPESEKSKFIRAIRCKGSGKEKSFINTMQQLPFFWVSLNAALK